MKNFTIGFIALLGGALTLAPGCSDDADDTSGSGNAAGEGGSTGKGGSTSKGGTQSTGGDTSDAGEGNTVGGESAGGGEPGTGGDGNGGTPGGEGGAGGAGFMNPEGCPAEAPVTGGDCFADLEVQSACEYPGSRCVCNGYMGSGGAGGAEAGGNWICRGDGDECPATAPATDDACEDNGLHCPYPGGNECFCSGGDWDCSDPEIGGPGQGGGPGEPLGECTETPPQSGDDCVGPIPTCFYDDTNTLCTCPGAGPDADTWSCQTL